MDWTKLVFSMFTNRGKESRTWPRSMISSHRNHICTRNLSYQHSEKPEILRLNSIGETPTEGEFVADSSGLVRKGILGDFPSKVTDMPVHNNNHHHYNHHQPHASYQMGSFQNSWIPCKLNPIENGYNFNMAQRQYRFPAFGMSYQPPSPWQQNNNVWAYPGWFPNAQGSFYGNPFAGSAAYQGMPFVTNGNSGFVGSPRRHCFKNKKVAQSSQPQGKSQVTEKENKTMPTVSTSEKEIPIVTEAKCVNSVADALKEIHISSESDEGSIKNRKDQKLNQDSSLRMYVTVKDITNATKSDAGESVGETKKENVPIVQKRVCDNCKKCVRKDECLGIGYCLLGPSNGHAKLTLILESKENVGKMSNSNGKNGYHEKGLMTANGDSAELSDERVPSQNGRDVCDINSSHSLGLKPKFGDSATTTKPSLVAKVLLQRNTSSKRKPTRPSCKKRRKDKIAVTAASKSNEKSAESKRRKVNHRNPEVSSTTNCNSNTNSTVAYILGFSPPQNTFDTKAAQIHCKVSVQPDKFSFTISSGSEDTDFSDDEDDDGVVALSEDDADIWNSFNKCDDPYNPMNFLTPTCSSVPKVIPKSSSAPTLLTPEVLCDDDIWQKDPPAFSPPKPEALIRTAKKVHFATDGDMVQVHAADEWERKGPWEQMALDSQRFYDRIQKTEQAIGHIFNEQHRQDVLEKVSSYNK